MPTTQITEITASIDAIAARTNSAGGAVSPDWGAEERRMDLALFTAGICMPQNAYRVVAGSAATMNIVIGSGAAKVDIAMIAGITAGQGNYLVRLDEAGKTIALSAADPSNPRIDEVYLVAYDNLYDSTSRSLPRLVVRRGDASGSPALPGPDAAWKSYLLLAQVDVPAAAADILACTITDKRVYSGLALADGGSVPVGTMLDFAGSVAPAGYFLCDGSAKSRTTYARLFAVCGILYGSGDGSTTFNIPDSRGKYTFTKAAAGTGSTLGATFGSIDHTHSQPTHTHTGPSHTHTGPSHTHTAAAWTGNTTSNGSHSHGGVTEEAQNASGGNDYGNSGTLTEHAHIINLEGDHFHNVANVGGTTNASGTGATGASGTAATGAAGNDQTGATNPIALTTQKIIKY